MIFFTACLFILFTFSAHAVRPPRQGTTYDIEASYRVNFGTDVDGGCKTYETKIRTAYGELLDLMQGASDSLDDLKSPLPPDKGSAASNEWLRKSDAFFALFGARIPAAGWQTGDVQQESEKLTTRVWLNYVKFLQRHRQIITSPNREFRLMCSDNWLRYLGPNDLDPTDPDNRRKVKDNPEAVEIARGNPQNGIYYASSLPSGRHKGALAETIFEEGDGGLVVITFCPQQLDAGRWSASISTEIQDGDFIEKFSGAIAVTWLHELGHAIFEWDDEIAVNRKGLPFIESGGSKAKTYGWDRSVLLAQKKPEAAKVSPENYAFFAATMFWSDWWWITGNAQTAAQIGAAGK